MRAMLPVLALLTPLAAPLLAGCERPPATAYREDPRGPGQTGEAAEGSYERVMADGTRANLSGRSPEAMALFRKALKMRETRFGKGHPETALPLMSLALQLSVEGQYPEADTRFAETEQVLRASRDRALKARLPHYRAVHLLNQKKPREAEALLSTAQAAYTALIPPDILAREPIARIAPNRFDVNALGRIASTAEPRGANDASLQPVLLGLIETLRYRAIALRELNRAEEADALTAQAVRIAGGNDLGRASVYARVYRTSGVTASNRSLTARTATDLGRSDAAFEESLPETRPAAEAKMIRAGELLRAGGTSAALSLCRRAVRTLIAIASGTSPELMAPCLDAYAAGGGWFGSGSGNRAEMFMAAQVAQGTITSHQIAQASAALSESARNPAIGQALRERDALQRDLDRIYRAMDTFGGAAPSDQTSEKIGQLQREADQKQAALVQAQAKVRALSPNFSQLVQDVVPAADVFAQLRPNEAFIALFLSERSGWAFALRNGQITAARIEGGSGVIGPLVKQVRSGMETQAGVFDVEATRRLYDLTLGGVSGAIRGAAAYVIAPTGPLLSVPFEVLLTGPADPAKLAEAPWFLRQGTITHVPAPANFVGLRKVAHTSRAQKTWFGFGDFRKASVAQIQAGFPDRQCGRDRAALAGLPLLSGATAELQSARTILGAPPSDALLADTFTAEQVMNHDLKSYQVLHFAAHALLPTDLECQSEASIVTSPPPGRTGREGWLLTASRLLELDLDANLVILSACNSGGGDGKSGESLSGLARSFFFAKARSLMVTHWPVDDKFGSALVQLTVLGMKEKPELGVTAALRDTQLEILDAIASGKNPNTALAHPYYWAPFAVVGEGNAGVGRSTVSSNP